MNQTERLKRTPYRLLRFLARCCALAAAVVLVAPILPWRWTAMVLPNVSPYLTLCSAIAARSFGIVSLVGLPVLVIAALRGRWFCRWACPVGLITEQAGRLFPVGKPWAARLPPLGQWIALITLAGACLGYPLLVWLDPLALFAGFSSLWTRSLTAAAVLAGIGLPAVVLLSFLVPNAWCLRICPLGAAQDLLAMPRRVLGRAQPLPDEPPGRSLRPVARRTVLGVALGAVWAWATLETARGSSRPIRPPGSADEERFTGLCVRCGNCVRVCPTKILHPDLGEHGIAGFLAPLVRFEENYCLEDCCRCGEVCPSGAIARLTLDAKRTAVLGRPKLDLSLCLLADNRECTACVNLCPYRAIQIVFSEEEYKSFPQVDPAKCPGCGACQVACVAEPKAIVVHPR